MYDNHWDDGGLKYLFTLLCVCVCVSLLMLNTRIQWNKDSLTHSFTLVSHSFGGTLVIIVYSSFYIYVCMDMYICLNVCRYIIVFIYFPFIFIFYFFIDLCIFTYTHSYERMYELRETFVARLVQLSSFTF